MFTMKIDTHSFCIYDDFDTIDDCLRCVEDHLEGKADIRPCDVIEISVKPTETWESWKEKK